MRTVPSALPLLCVLAGGSCWWLETGHQMPQSAPRKADREGGGDRDGRREGGKKGGRGEWREGREEREGEEGGRDELREESSVVGCWRQAAELSDYCGQQYMTVMDL